jgi:lysozyme
MLALIVVGIAAVWIVMHGNSGPGADAPESGQTSSDGTMNYVEPPVMNYTGPTGDLTAPNMGAFLSMIRQSECGTSGPEAYTMFYGGSQFSDLSQHPCEAPAQEQPVLLSDGSGNYTTAAGAYQITLSTWNRYGGTARYGSFSSQAQDQCAADIIAACGAAGHVADGAFSAAYSKLSNQWASLTIENHASNLAAYQAAGGSGMSS